MITFSELPLPLNMTSFGNISKDRAVWQNMRCPQFKYETIIPWSVFEDSLNGRRRKKLFFDFGAKLTENPSDIRSRRIFVDVIFVRLLHRDVEHSDNLFECRSVGRDGTSVESDQKVRNVESREVGNDDDDFGQVVSVGRVHQKVEVFGREGEDESVSADLKKKVNFRDFSCSRGVCNRGKGTYSKFETLGLG